MPTTTLLKSNGRFPSAWENSASAHGTPNGPSLTQIMAAASVEPSALPSLPNQDFGSTVDRKGIHVVRIVGLLAADEASTSFRLVYSQPVNIERHSPLVSLRFAALYSR